jgi:hypothetical protein
VRTYTPVVVTPPPAAETTRPVRRAKPKAANTTKRPAKKAKVKAKVRQTVRQAAAATASSASKSSTLKIAGLLLVLVVLADTVLLALSARFIRPT